MKKLFNIKYNSLLSFLSLIIISANSISQTVYSSKEQSTFTFNVGLTTTGEYRDTISYTQGVLFSGGATYLFAVSDKSNIGIEASYIGKAFKRSNPIIKYRYFYVEIPLFYQYKFSENIRGNIGIQYSKYLNSYYYYLDGSQNTGVHKLPLNTKLGDDYGLLLGLDIGILKNFYLGARYSISTSSFLENNTPYMGTFQFTLRAVVFRGYKQLFNKHLEPTK